MTAAKASALLLLAIIALMILEGGVLAWLWRYRGRGVPPAALAANLLAGISLVMATLVLVLGAAMPWLLACLALALLTHVVDLKMRWHSRPAYRPAGRSSE